MSNFETIPQAAIDSLVADPKKAQGFDAVFGKGRAQEVLSSRTPEPSPEPAQQDPGVSFASKVWDSTGRAVAHGAQEAVNETIDAVESFDIWASQKLDALGVPSRLQLYDVSEDGTTGSFNPQLKFYHESLNDRDFLGGTVGNKGDAAEINLVAQPQTITGGIVGGISQFVTGFAGISKFTKLGGLRGAFANGAIADALVFDPNDANITGLLEEFGVETGQLGEILATDPDDPEYINRLRNAAEGVLAGGVMEAIGWSIRSLKARKAGNLTDAKKFTIKEEEALSELDAALKEAGEEAIKDAEESINLSKTLFDDEGQLSFDLGDTPQANPVKPDLKKDNPNRIFLTPEKVENIRYHAQLAAGATKDAKAADLSFRSLNTVTDFEDVLDEIAGTQTVMADEFLKIKGGDAQRWSTVKAQAAAKVRQMAKMTGEDPEALIRKFTSANLGDTAKLAAEVHARSRYLLTIEQDLKEMAQAITKGEFTPDRFPGIRDMDHLRLAFSQRREVAANLLAGQDALRSNVARAMNAMKIAVKGDEKLKEMLKDPSMFRDVDAAAAAVADPANAGESAIKTIDDTMSALHGFMDKVNSFRINALLSGPGTQEVNMISNAINSFVIPAEQMIGGAASGDMAAVRHGIRTLQGYTAGMLDAGKAALQAGWMDDAILDIPSAGKVEDYALTKSSTALGTVVNLPSRFLMTMDEFFKQSQYRGRVFADAHEEALKEGLEGTAKIDFIQQYLKESYDESGRALRGDALLQARRATFTEPLEAGFAASIQKWAIDYPALRFVIPFIRTPVNILSQTFQHVPVAGALSSRWKADVAAGGVRRAQAYGKWVVGSSLMTAAGYLAANNLITGSGPSDPRIRKVWLQNNQPYSFRVDEEDGTVTWVSFARLEPLSNLFSIAADMVEISNDEFNEAETKGYMNALFMAVMENSVNKTFTQGIYDAMSILVSNKQHERDAALRNMIASFIPNAANQLNGDEVMREVRDLTDAFMARTHLFNGVDPKRNVLGEPVVRRLPKYDPLGLTHKDNREVDLVLQEVTRVAILNQSVADNPSKKIAGPDNIKLTEVPYSDTQSLYDRWVELTGEVKISGKTLREKLTETFKSPSYIEAPDGYVGSTSGTKGAMVRKIISTYRKKAQSELPELVELRQSQQRHGAKVLRQQKRSNRELFPTKPSTQQAPRRRRTFEDLIAE